MKSQIRKLKIALKDEERKPILQMFYELCRSGIQEKDIPRHYFSNLLYKKGRDDYLDFLGLRNCFFFMRSPKIHDGAITQFLKNKLLFHRFFSRTEIKIPELIGFNSKEHFCLPGGNARKIENVQDFKQFFVSFLDEESCDYIFIKPIEGERGKDCFRLDKKNCSPNNDYVDLVFRRVKNGNFIFEKGIKQHKEIMAMHPKSVNPIRIETFFDKKTGPEIVSAAISIGKGGSFVGSRCQGGFGVKIRIDSGRINEYGLMMLEYGNGRIYRHPDTEYEFKGKVIPFFDEVKTVAKKATILLPNTLIGWDIAISEEGPLIIEGNAPGHNISGQQTVCGGYRKNPVFKKVLEEFGR